MLNPAAVTYVTDPSPAQATADDGHSTDDPLGGTTFVIIGKISVYKHCFCYSNVPTTGIKDPLFPQHNR